MTDPSKKALRGNIVKFAWYKVLTKRTYLPIIAIYLVEIAHVSIAEIALIAVITAIIQLALQLPGGYFADYYGNKKALQYSTWFITFSPLCYVLFPNFWGGLLGSILFFGGWAFQQGSGEAFMHDTMVALNEKHKYAKIMGRAQSYGLLGNLLLTAFIPSTYLIDPRLPFLLGFVSLVVMSALIYSFVYPPHTRPSVRPTLPIALTKGIATQGYLGVFLFAGTAAAISGSGIQYQELLFQSVSVSPSLFGFITSAGSLLGAILGLFTHFLTNRLPSRTFYLLDTVVLSATLGVAGFFAGPTTSVGAMIIFLGYSRIRMIVVQSKLLEDTHMHKATLLSSLSFLVQLLQIGTFAYFGWLVTQQGLAGGHFWFGFSSFAVLMVLWVFATRLQPKKKRSLS